MDTLKDVIKQYFDDGFTYLEIVEMLRIRNGMTTTLPKLKYFFRKNGWKKRALAAVRNAEETVRQAVRDQLNGSSQGLGYRRIHRILTNNGIVCRREDVRKFILEFDREGVDLRRKRRLHRRKYVTRGPNYVWHVDGHDKLKPFGFSIHGCIDGYSRKIIWLEVGRTNKVPEVIGKYYLDAVSSYGCPRYLKVDDGTEHALIEPFHISIRNLDTDEETALNSFSIITSPQNQRIEAYWSILKRDKIGWWKRFFEDLTDLDLYAHDPVIVECIRFCFMALIRKDLESIKNDWNVHIISKSKNRGPRGRPDTMYYLPHLFESQSYSIDVEQEELQDLYVASEFNIPDVSEEFKEFARITMTSNGYQSMPNNVSDALDLYIFLLQQIENHS
uniref:Integrase core domain-containing protein n=1 Tax=Clytia hemisphaerica TaxID=252671 RepID=A0A7M5TXY9_9CNID